jgi:hypothetical protein
MSRSLSRTSAETRRSPSAPSAETMGQASTVSRVDVDQRGQHLDSPPDIGAFQSQGSASSAPSTVQHPTSTQIQPAQAEFKGKRLVRIESAAVGNIVRPKADPLLARVHGVDDAGVSADAQGARQPWPFCRSKKPRSACPVARSLFATKSELLKARSLFATKSELLKTPPVQAGTHAGRIHRDQDDRTPLGRAFQPAISSKSNNRADYVGATP